MATRRTQPYRATASRQQGQTLRAMTAGRGPLRHIAPGEVRRRAMKKRGKRKSRARYSSPIQKILATRRNLGG